MRPHDANSRLRAAVAVPIAARVLQLAVQVWAVPKMLPHLGHERYGAWMTIVSLSAVFGLADLGLGNGLIRRLGAAHARGEEAEFDRILGNGLAILVALSVTGLAVGAALTQLVPVAGMLGAGAGAAAAEIRAAFLLFASLSLATLPLTCANRARIARQQIPVNAVWDIAASAMTVVAVLLVLRLEAGLVGAVLAYTGTQAVAMAGNAATFTPLWRAVRRLRPAVVEAALLKDLLRGGLAFFLLQISLMLAVASDNLVVAHLFGPAEVADFSVIGRLYAIPEQMILLALAPLWPAYVAAASRGDQDWIAVTFKRSLLAASGVAVAAAGLLLAGGDRVLELWVGRHVTPPPGLMAASALWLVVWSVINCYAMLFNGLGRLRLQVVTAMGVSVLALALKPLLALALGVSGVILGKTLAYLLVMLPPFALFGLRLKDSLAGRAVSARQPASSRD